MTTPLKEGRLLKRGSVSWKGRFFVLRVDSITYYVDKGGGESRGEIALTKSSLVIPFAKRALAFQVVTGTKSLTMCASSAREQQEWQEAIQSAIGQLGTSSAAAAQEEWHVVSAAGQDFEMSPKYEMIKPIGHGAYGVVISAIDHQNSTKVAIKKIPDTFEDLVDAKRIVREIHLLRGFDHDNVIRVVDLFTPQPHEDFNDVYIVSDLMETDMHRVIYSKQQLTAEHIQFFLYQMLCGLNYIHSCGVVHRDLKPSNILLNANCDLKLCDFGLSRGLSEDRADLTEYVVTRWYRAPEIMLSCPSYDSKIDVWSVGCIFGEMFERKPMFPGTDYIHQLKLIMKVVGTPDETGLGFVSNEKARRFVLNLPKYDRANLKTTYPKASDDAVDLMAKMLVLDPSRRISVRDALDHKYFAEIRDPQCESQAPRPIEWGDIETCELSKANLQRLFLADFEALELERELPDTPRPSEAEASSLT